MKVVFPNPDSPATYILFSIPKCDTSLVASYHNGEGRTPFSNDLVSVAGSAIKPPSAWIRFNWKYTAGLGAIENPPLACLYYIVIDFM